MIYIQNHVTSTVCTNKPPYILMGRKDNNYGHSNIDKYRKQLGKQEFKGRNKKNTLLAKNRAQSRVPDGSFLQTLLLYSMVILVLLLGIYALFYFMLEKPIKKL